MMYAATERGDIVVIELSNNRGSEGVECKVKGRIPSNEEYKTGDVLNMET